jgi:hypothetical protein
MPRYFRKVIRIRAEDSPNVQLALDQQRRGEEPTGTLITPGVLTWDDYCKRRAMWDPVRQCIGLDGEFYKGPQTLMFPPQWLNEAERVADRLVGTRRKAIAIGVDTAEGGDKTCWAVIDELGIIDLISVLTPDTSVIPNRTIALMREHDVQPEMVMFDRGGGGYQHACELRARGYDVKAVSFGESVTPEKVPWMQPFDEKVQRQERRHVYFNRRAEMYGMVRLRLDPTVDGVVFAISAEYTELRRQMAVVPLLYDEEGRIVLPPKRKRNDRDTRTTLIEMIGHSPDEADALALAVYVMDAEMAPVVLTSMI